MIHPRDLEINALDRLTDGQTQQSDLIRDPFFLFEVRILQKTNTTIIYTGIPTTKSNNSEANHRVPATHAVDDDVRHQVRVPAAHKALQRCFLRALSKATSHAQAAERLQATCGEVD